MKYQFSVKVEDEISKNVIGMDFLGSMDFVIYLSEELFKIFKGCSSNNRRYLSKKL